MVPPNNNETPKDDQYSLSSDNHNLPSEKIFVLIFNFKLLCVEMIINQMFLQLYKVLTLIKNQSDFFFKQKRICSYKQFHLQLYMGAQIKYIHKTFSFQCVDILNLKIMPTGYGNYIWKTDYLVLIRSHRRPTFIFIAHILSHFS